VDGSCSSGVRNNFDSTSGGNSFGAADPVSFSICYGVPNALAGGKFIISDGVGDTAVGIFSGIFVGLSANNGDIFDGTFELTSTTGYYDAVAGAQGIFDVTTGNVDNANYLTGNIDFIATPEPVTFALAGLGLLLAVVSRRRPALR
jgi:uncharacterized protein (TIGR03382 family)